MLPVFQFAVGAAAALLLMRQRRTYRQAIRLGSATLETLLNAIDANDEDTGRHVRRVAQYALELADAAGLSESETRSVERVALFHDIGKIHEALFDILHDGSRLSPEARRAIKTHPARGAKVLEPLHAFYPDLPAGVLAHHERWDGTGYPRRLKGRRIPQTARIVAIVDAFDAITHGRDYSRALSRERAREALLAGRGTQFDPDLVDLFLSPMVQECVADIRLGSGKRGRGSNRRGERAQSAPDLIFRWWPATPARRPRRRPRRTAS
ncbi:MAG: HD domain-containing protein [Gemmatimonadaceae bacterium]|nr:HD domain-containing protein [Gemmatimonadaceae bacterium]